MTGPWYWNPEWWQVILIVAGTGIAAWAFISERNAVRLTQRADVLLTGHSFDPPGAAALTGHTIITLQFQNYGPTQASNVKVEVDLSIEGVTQKKFYRDLDPNIPLMVVGAGVRFPISFPPLTLIFDEDVIARASSGEVSLRFASVVTYDDVFGVRHTTRNEGHYFGLRGSSFVVDKHVVT